VAALPGSSASDSTKLGGSEQPSLNSRGRAFSADHLRKGIAGPSFSSRLKNFLFFFFFFFFIFFFL